MDGTTEADELPEAGGVPLGVPVALLLAVGVPEEDCVGVLLLVGDWELDPVPVAD